MTEAIPLVDVIAVLAAADKGWPDDRGGWCAEAVASARWNGYLNDDAQLTDDGRQFLVKFGFLHRGD